MEQEHDKRVIQAYLKYGSVDEILKREYDLNIHMSQAGIHRLIKKWGIIKAAGPNTNIAEVIYFLEKLAYEKIPLERLYKKMPLGFQTSAVTLHRILSYVKTGMTRRSATALVITLADDPNKILIGKDISTPRIEYGKFYGAWSIPMGFSKKGESKRDSIIRVLQQEVFSQQIIDKSLNLDLLLANSKKIVNFDVIDIRLSLYHISLPIKLGKEVNSYKLTEFDFKTLEEIFYQKKIFRAGVPELCGMYTRFYQNKKVRAEKDIPVVISELNLALVQNWDE